MPHRYNEALIAGAVLSALAPLLQVGCIVYGAPWYRFFGAGENMARMAEAGHWRLHAARPRRPTRRAVHAGAEHRVSLVEFADLPRRGQCVFRRVAAGLDATLSTLPRVESNVRSESHLFWATGFGGIDEHAHDSSARAVWSLPTT